MSAAETPSRRYAVIGAGAIGAYVGAALSHAGHDVTLFGRGPHLRAMQTNGVTVKSPRGDFSARPHATDDFASIGPVDVVLLTLKAHQLGAVMDALPSLFKADTPVVAIQNGIPWWYFDSHGGPYDGLRLESVDPGGKLAKAIPAERVIGCVIYCSTEIESPGVIRHLEGTRYSLGEPNRSISARAQAISTDLIGAGLKAPVEANLRNDIWLKLLGNAAFNPISTLTRATLEEMTNDPGVEPLVREMMEEAVAIATKLGVTFDVTIDKRIDGARKVGAHKTSMLQDLEARKAFELDAITGAVVELGEKMDIPTPATRHVLALTRLLERSIIAGR